MKLDEIDESNAQAITVAADDDCVDNVSVDDSDVNEGASASEILERPELDDQQYSALIEALIFAAGEPLSSERLQELTGLENEKIELLIQEIIERYQNNASGLDLVCVADCYQFRTKSLYSSYIRALRAGRPRRLSAQALETLAIVAYRQPIVKSDVEKIRGVDATPTLKTLLERRLIRIAGHQASVGQPALYGTTDDFLKLFGLKSLSELPSLRDLKEIDGEPGEVAEQLLPLSQQIEQIESV